ncbi:MAG: hypothetical protein HOP15_06850 [Planctomycetes bacterium]|nr:hypothetical protein [Planctomycetota bacterium]
MSLLLGSPNERLTLARAVDALADAARRAGRPNALWLVGVFYPGLNLNFDLVRGVLALVQEFSGVELLWAGEMGGFVALFGPGIPGVNLGLRGTEELGSVLLTLPLCVLAFRMIVGLARVSDPLHAASAVELVSTGSTGVQVARGPRLGDLWRAGKDLALVAFGLWGMLLLMLFGAMLVLIAPLVALLKLFDLARFSALFAGLLLPVLVLVLLYAAVLMVLNQLALHSLAQNRRGVASALTHAWRLVRASPLGALRATLVDFVLFLSVLAGEVVLGTLVHPSPVLRTLLVLALFGFAGVTRAAFWARTYRALGGLSPADNVPGL